MALELRHRHTNRLFLVLCTVLGLWCTVARGLDTLASSLDDSNYRIEYLYLEDYEPQDLLSTPPDHQDVFVTRHDGVLFRCTLPDPQQHRNVDHHQEQDHVQDQERDEETSSYPPPPTIAMMLGPLKQNCLLRLEGWWTYEFCFGKWVQQYHQEGESRIALFTLGVASLHEQDETRQRKKIETDEGLREAYTELYEDGTMCDITGKPRTVELAYYCAPTARTGMLLALKEPSTCNYAINVATSLLCRHPEFLIEEKPEKLITCREVPQDYDDEGDEGDDGQGGGGYGEDGEGMIVFPPEYTQEIEDPDMPLLEPPSSLYDQKEEL